MCSCREGGDGLTNLPSLVPAKEKEEEEDAMEVLEGPQEGEPDTSGHPMVAVIPDPDEQVGVPIAWVFPILVLKYYYAHVSAP